MIFDHCVKKILTDFYIAEGSVWRKEALSIIIN
jgi:hypothetical protein